MSSEAVVLMAYGSPERLADVPAYYADIRGGRPIAPENLADLVERYRRLGIEDSSPLNAITERTRAALEAELGLPVFTGMKHWPPRIADAAEAALAAGAEHDRRPRARAALLRALDQGLPRPARAGARRPRRPALRRQLARRAGLRRAARRQDPRHGRARRLHRALASRAGARDGRSVQGPAARDEQPRRGRRRRRRLVLLVPEREPHRRAVARPGHPRPPARAARARRRTRARLPGRLRLRPPRDPLGSRRRGEGARAASSGSSSSGSRCRTTRPRSCARLRRSSGAQLGVPSPA